MHSEVVFLYLFSFSFCLLLFHHVSASSFLYKEKKERTLKVSTYNLWNVMFNWDVRKFRIAQMIKEEDPDLIAFQEVRAHKEDKGRKNQINELRLLLPKFKWNHFLPINIVEVKRDVFIQGWELEGIGFLSRHPFENLHIQNLTYTEGPDTNKRAIIHVGVRLPNDIRINVAIVHFSYDRRQQCSNAVELLHFINENAMENVIALGDFNTYKDFDLPLSLLEQSKSVANSVCFNINVKYRQKYSLVIRDAWTMLNPTKRGLTFSNMPKPGPESRPDRVLISQNLRSVSASLNGNGAVYKSKFFYHVLWQRAENLLWAAHASYSGEEGRSCIHDCGPHASCRCGVCVSGGDKRSCALPHCDECNSMTFTFLVLVFIFFICLFAQLLYGVLLVLLTMNERAASRKATQMWFGNCCLCDPELYVSVSQRIKRRTRQSFLWKFWPFCRLPPMVLVIVTLGIIFLSMEISIMSFQELFDDMYAMIPEEMYPSDHLLLTVELAVVKTGV